jgi:predicted nucleic acid-binding protein
MILVDTTVWIDYFNGRLTPHTDTLDRLLGQQMIIVGDLVLAELLQGFRKDDEFGQVCQALQSFTPVSLVTPELAIQSARNYRTLRRFGTAPRKTIDCLIATACIENGYRLLHHDSDFDGFELHLGLAVIHP